MARNISLLWVFGDVFILKGVRGFYSAGILPHHGKV